jgi:hypothetical protein
MVVWAAMAAMLLNCRGRSMFEMLVYKLAVAWVVAVQAVLHALAAN